MKQWMKYAYVKSEREKSIHIHVVFPLSKDKQIDTFLRVSVFSRKDFFSNATSNVQIV